MMTEKTKARLVYGWWWIWLGIVTVAWFCIYREATEFLGAFVGDIPALSQVLAAGNDTWIVPFARGAAAILLWWRIVKVVVLLGSPLPFGMVVGSGRQEGGTGGRIAHCAHIGDFDVYGNNYQGEFFFGAVFRAHPRSDKLVRSRLESLTLALPFGLTVVVGESRLLIRRKSHQERGKIHRLRWDMYSKTTEKMPPDKFRLKAVKSLKSIAQNLN